MQVPDLRGLNGVTAISPNWGLTYNGSAAIVAIVPVNVLGMDQNVPAKLPRRSRRCLSETLTCVV
jgi:hypothetical protein